MQAPARLHLGFLDPGGSLGRRFGSVGLVIDGLDTVVELALADADDFTTFPGGLVALARARDHLRALRHATGCEHPLALRLRGAPRMHAGLGSGTQLALALARAFCTLFALDRSSSSLAALLGRGARSGVGIAGFDRGGLLVDGGPRADAAPADLLAHVDVPTAWRAILVLDPRAQGLSGAAEKAALARLEPLPREAAAEICHEVLMRILPGAAGAEFAPFAAGLGRMQQVLGAHFAPVQSGRRFASPAVGRLLQWIGEHAQAGIGQSSWGPAGYAFLASELEARQLLAAAIEARAVDPALELLVVRARNQGAAIHAERGEA